jgi:hypothetical protein
LLLKHFNDRFHLLVAGMIAAGGFVAKDVAPLSPQTEKGRAISTAFSICLNFSAPLSRVVRRKFVYPAARRLSADDLPERRSATIS